MGSGRIGGVGRGGTSGMVGQYLYAGFRHVSARRGCLSGGIRNTLGNNRRDGHCEDGWICPSANRVVCAGIRDRRFSVSGSAGVCAGAGAAARESGFLVQRLSLGEKSAPFWLV